MVSDASELDTIMVSDSSEEFKSPQEPGTPALRRSSRRIRFWWGSSKKMSRAKICPVCEASPGPKKGGRPPGEWANGLCQRHALESGCRPPRRKKRRVMCKTCQEIGRKEDEATDKGFPLVRTKLRIALDKVWAHGMCWRHALESGCQPPAASVCIKCREIGRKEDEAADKLKGKLVRTKLSFAHGSCHGMCERHARLAGLSRKRKLFEAREPAAPNDAGKKQKKLPFFMVPKTSQSQMAVDGSIEEESHGSIEPPPENP